ncbi:unnamed protein product, partial [Ectocarpus sp. 12 AP-2014]
MGSCGEAGVREPGTPEIGRRGRRRWRISRRRRRGVRIRLFLRVERHRYHMPLRAPSGLLWTSIRTRRC